MEKATLVQILDRLGEVVAFGTLQNKERMQLEMIILSEISQKGKE